MKLRNGKTYYTNKPNGNIFINITENYYRDTVENNKPIILKSSKPDIDIPFSEGRQCVICSKIYKKNELICSCHIDNIHKHSFHKKCLRLALNNQKQYETQYKHRCPYCFSRISIKSMPIIKIS